MSQVDYAAMTYQALRRYFLAHRDDSAAFEAYLARRRERSRVVITTINDPDFDRKIHASIERQMAEYERSGAS
ncbi:DUF6887 family protein [Leptolyngbya ohadii]|uniref:DUF6887 family protein n=1 Tax=Leptolyngbya ohadii TaxID=1962290 RepID=UPI000B59F2AC|nr:hypothetical protein [Leptolyngbya ohadii]